MPEPQGKQAVDRAYLSIGEVLSLLREEFPDVTISKIRFLESQGLLDPERTPSGYRKFYDADVERLRWILRQQRENFLPLKVIKGRLGGDQPGNGADVEGDDGPRRSPTLEDDGGPSVIAPSSSGASLTLDELCSAAGLAPADVAELEKFGLVTGRPVAGVVYYDEDAMLVANLAASFQGFGVQARHLRMYRTAAEREAGFIEQVVLPLLKQRNPEARRQALDNIDDLARLGQNLRAAMLRQLLRRYLEGPS
jgi:DNA-binding transcriptional MerR regulator